MHKRPLATYERTFFWQVNCWACCYCCARRGRAAHRSCTLPLHTQLLPLKLPAPLSKRHVLAAPIVASWTPPLPAAASGPVVFVVRGTSERDSENTDLPGPASLPLCPARALEWHRALLRWT